MFLFPFFDGLTACVIKIEADVFFRKNVRYTYPI